MMDTRSARRSPIALLLLFFAGAYAVFLLVGASDSLHVGHDHWTTGHAMLLSEGYLNAGFATPWLVPVEDVARPVNGLWAPYTGWPPLFFILLALFRKCVGPSLGTARWLFAGLTAASAALVALIAYRVTARLVWGALVAWAAFCFSPIALGYCALGSCDTTLGLAWSLCFVMAYPSLIRERSWRAALCLQVLSIIGALIAWQCYIAALACTLAHGVVNRVDWKASGARLLAPLMAMACTAALMLAVYVRSEALYAPNGWGEWANLGVKNNTGSILRKFLFRTGLADSSIVFAVVGQFFENLFVEVCAGYAPILLLCLIVVLVRPGMLKAERSLPSSIAAAQVARFYLLALLLMPLLWLACMPIMHEHDFQLLFWMPVIAVGWSLVAANLSERLRPPARGALIGVIIGALMAAGIGSFSPKPDSELFARLEADIRRLAGQDTMVAMGIEDRGAWWRLGRPVTSLRKIGLIQGRRHLVVVPLSGSVGAGWEGRYREVARRTGYDGNYDGYRILAPIEPHPRAATRGGT